MFTYYLCFVMHIFLLTFSEEGGGGGGKQAFVLFVWMPPIINKD